MPVRCCLSAALAAVAVIALPRPGPALSLDDVELWTGSGTNRAALVIDWRNGNTPQSLVWGYRWDGSATAGDMFLAIAGHTVVKPFYSTNATGHVAGNDPRLFAVLSDQGSGLSVFGLGYDLDDDGGSFTWGAEGSGTETGAAEDPDDHYAEGWFSANWSHWIEPGGAGGFDRMPRWGEQTTANPDGEWQYAGAGVSTRPLHNGSWDAWKFIDQPYVPWDPDQQARWEARRVPPLYPRIATHHPFAVRVVAYDGAPPNPVDPSSGLPYDDPEAALGRPTIDTSGDDNDIPAGDTVPVVPVYAAFRRSEIVTLGFAPGGGPGQLTLEFDHAVLDHPGNPWGMDLVVFGNAFLHADPAPWTNGNPAAHTVGDLALAESCTVEVSQDGATWFPLPSPGPAAPDGFPPTLGRRFDPDAPDPALGPGNAWWGRPTDPVFPIDPAIASADVAGWTVADLACRYRGSAGGAGFDLALSDLPADPGSGKRWCRFIRLTRGVGFPEIDAVTDVAPAPPYARWRIETFPWTGDPALERDDADPDGDRIPNLVEYLFGFDPFVPDPAPLRIRAHANDAVRISHPLDPDIVDVDWRIETRPTPPATPDAAWTTDGIVQRAATAADTVEAEAPAGGSGRAVFRIRVDAPDPWP